MMPSTIVVMCSDDAAADDGLAGGVDGRRDERQRPDDVGDEARAQRLEVVGQRADRRAAAEQRLAEAAEDQHAGQRDDEARYLGGRRSSSPAPRRCRPPTSRQMIETTSGLLKMPSGQITIIMAASAPMKPGDRADAEVDVAGDDDQQHAQRHHDDEAVLLHQVGEVHRLEQRAVGGELEEHHDRRSAPASARSRAGC